MSWMLIIKLIVATSAVMSLCLNVIIIIYLYNKHRNFHKDVINNVLDGINRGRLSRKIDEEKSKIEFNVLNKVNRMLPNIEKLRDEIIDDIRRLEGYDKIEQEELLQSIKVSKDSNCENKEIKDDTITIKPNICSKVYFASAVKENDSTTFYSVSETPIIGESIFQLIETKTGEYEFEVYSGAYNLVLQETEYIRGACYISKSGNSTITMVKNGIVNRTLDGKWVIKELARVKIE